MGLKNRAKHFFGHYPKIFFGTYRIFGPKRIVEECLLSPEKELVIEGFPRSANTFAVVAFRQAQRRNVSLAHHLHVEAQILEGVRRRLPVIVLIRHPIDAIRSLLIRHPETDMEWAFARYIQFYESILHLKNEVVLARFDEIATNYGAIIDRINRKFGCKYAIFEHTAENLHRVNSEIEFINNVLDGGKETHIARPSEERNQSSNLIVIPRDSLIVRHAVGLYETFTEHTEMA